MNDRQQYQLAVLRQQDERLMATSNPNPGRITAALNLAGLDGPEVDRACGVEEPAVDMWEAGTLVPTREQVEALATLTGFPPAFFYRDSPAGIGPAWLCGDDGCERVGESPPEPLADVVWLPGPARLF